MKQAFSLLLIICCLPCRAQFRAPYYYRDIYEQQSHFDSLIRTELKGELGESYYVISYPLLGATTSWVPQFIKCYDAIRSTRKDIVIVFYSKGGPRKKDVPLFMHTLFKLHDSDITHLKCIYNDQLYDAITGKRNLVRLQYYFRRQLFYDQGEKWHSIREIVLPQEHIKIHKTDKVRLTGIDSLMLFERDPLFPFRDGHLLVLNDARNEISDLDVKTGTVTSLLKPASLLSACDMYCGFCTNDTAKCRYARENEHFAADRNRKMVMVDGLSYRDGQLILFLNIEAYEKREKPFVFKNDENTGVTQEIGQKSLNVYSFIVTYDLTSKAVKVSRIDEIPSRKDTDYYSMPESGCYLLGDSILTSYTSYDKNGASRFGLTSLMPVKGAYQSTPGLPPGNIRNQMASMYFKKNFFFMMSNQLYFMVNFSGDMFLPGRYQVQSTFYGNGNAPFSKEQFHTYTQDTLTPEINFLFHEVKTVFQDSYILGYCEYKGSPIFELKNRLLKTVDIIDARSIEGFAPYFDCPYRSDLLIDNDKIYFKSLENDEIYLNVFTIQPLTVQRP